MPDSPMLKHALRYAAAGVFVFPLATSGDIKAPHPMLGKRDPVTGKAAGHTEATIDPAVIRRWWSREPRAGIGGWLARSGLIALDVDPREGGDKALAELEAVFGPVGSVVQATTGGKGEHRLYAAPAGLSPPGQVLGRKGLDLKYNGYIVLPPSPHPYPAKTLAPGEKAASFYFWQAGRSLVDNKDFLMNVPEWLLRRDTQSKQVARPLAPLGADDDAFIEDSPKVGFSADQIATLLERVPNAGDSEQGYDSWLNVLAGIYHETDGSEEGRAAAEAWSEQSMKHESAKFQKSWLSLNEEGKGLNPVTFRYAMKLAKQFVEATAEQTAKDLRADLQLASTLQEFRDLCNRIKVAELVEFQRADLVSEVQKAFVRITGNKLPVRDARDATRYQKPEQTVPDWLVDWSYCAGDDVFMKAGSPIMLTKSAFNSMYDIKMLTRTERLEGLAVPAVRAGDAALTTFDIPKVIGAMYLPTQPKFFEWNGASYINTYSGRAQPEVPEVVSVEDQAAVDRVIAHFGHLVGDKRERELVISWLAYIVQTQQRVNWSIVIQGPEKDGKTFIQELMGIVLGATNVQVVDPTLLGTDFSDWAGGSLLTVFEEIKLHGSKRFDIIDKLKPFITNATVSMHPKGYKARPIVNTTSYLCLTNYRDALPLDARDSRFFLIESVRQLPEDVEAFHEANPTYFDQLFLTLETSAGALRKWLLNYPKHIEFKPKGRSPRSNNKETLARLNRSEAHDAIDDVLDDGSSPVLTSALLDTTTLSERLMTDEVDVPLKHTLRNLLLNQFGFVYLGRFKIDGIKRRYWSRTPDRFKGDNQATIARLIRYYVGAEDL